MKRKPYWEMTTGELQAATRGYDDSDVIDRSRPLTADERRTWNRLRKKRGRPKQGQGYRRISVSIEAGLLKQVTALAKKRQVSRSKLFALAIRDAMTKTP